MEKDIPLPSEELDLVRKRRLEAMHLQRIEGNPLDAGDIALLEMFDRKQWSFKKRFAHLRELGRNLARSHASE